tara:strand:- start:494 stop:1165 length:672 start_codon:yes stop_codon:yes gene_type:complete
MSEIKNCKLAVLASGNGSNLQALIDASKFSSYPAEISLVVSDNENAYALKRAEEAEIKTLFYNFKEKSNYKNLSDELKNQNIDLICCAGFMRIIPDFFVKEFAGKIVNIHPSLLPSFPGLNAQKQALDSGVRISGCTVHFVDEGVDTGSIIMQAAVPILPDDNQDALTQRILKFEHRIYPMAVKLIAENMVYLDDRTTHYNIDLKSIPEGFLFPGIQLRLDEK